jgi:hypothetical protein
VAAVALGDGHFRIAPLTEGSYRIEATDGVNPPATANTAVATGAARETTIVLDRGVGIRGRVVDGANQPVPDTWVSAACRQDGAPAEVGARPPTPAKRVVSDPQGRFAIANLQRGTLCSVRAEQPRGSLALKEGVRPGDDVTLALPELGALRGSASLPDGLGVDRFSITVQEGTSGRSRTEAVVSDHGHWALGKVLPGQLRITAWDDQGAAAQAQVDLAPGQTVDVPLQFRALRAGGATP